MSPVLEPRALRCTFDDYIATRGSRSPKPISGTQSATAFVCKRLGERPSVTLSWVQNEAHPQIVMKWTCHKRNCAGSWLFWATWFYLTGLADRADSMLLPVQRSQKTSAPGCRSTPQLMLSFGVRLKGCPKLQSKFPSHVSPQMRPHRAQRRCGPCRHDFLNWRRAGE